MKWAANADLLLKEASVYFKLPAHAFHAVGYKTQCGFESIESIKFRGLVKQAGPKIYFFFLNLHVGQVLLMVYIFFR